MDQVLTLLKLIIDILIQLLTYVKEGLEVAFKLFMQLIQHFF